MILDQDIQSQFADLGVSMDFDIPAPQNPDAEAFEVMPCNWSSVCAFLACETQWRAVPMTVGNMAAIATSVIWLGLDYSAADVVLRRLAGGDAVFADVQIMERAALDVFAEVQS